MNNNFNFASALSGIINENDYISTMQMKLQKEGQNSSVHEYSLLESRQSFISKKVNFLSKAAELLNKDKGADIVKDFTLLSKEETSKALVFLSTKNFLTQEELFFVQRDLFKEHNKIFTGYTKKFSVNLPNDLENISSDFGIISYKLIEQLKLGLSVNFNPENLEKARAILENVEDNKLEKDNSPSPSPFL